MPRYKHDKPYFKQWPFIFYKQTMLPSIEKLWLEIGQKNVKNLSGLFKTKITRKWPISASDLMGTLYNSVR